MTGGKGRALIVTTGSGKRAGAYCDADDHGACQPTPLQRRLEQFGHVLLVITGYRGRGVRAWLVAGKPLFEMFLTAVSLAVAAIQKGCRRL